MQEKRQKSGFCYTFLSFVLIFVVLRIGRKNEEKWGEFCKLHFAKIIFLGKNEEILHFSLEIFAYVEKKSYLCMLFRECASITCVHNIENSQETNKKIRGLEPMEYTVN